MIRHSVDSAIQLAEILEGIARGLRERAGASDATCSCCRSVHIVNHTSPVTDAEYGGMTVGVRFLGSSYVIHNALGSPQSLHASVIEALQREI